MCYESVHGAAWYKQTSYLAPPPCVNSAPTDRGPVRSRFTSDGPDTDRLKFLNMFKTVGPVRRSAGCPRTVRSPRTVRGQPTDRSDSCPSDRVRQM
jgi:hypothetical protein